MAKNPILASFNQQPVLLSEEMSETFEANIDQAFLTQTKVDTLIQTNPPEMADSFWPDPDSWFASYRPYTVTDGVLQIPVTGALLNGFTLATSWATGYEYIRKAFDRGMADPAVKGIALVIDSGGGAVNGNFDLVDHIYENRGTKPIAAFANEHAYSAAYSIASAADTINVARTGGVGSIGVLTMHVDVSAAMEKSGVKVTLVHFGKYKVEGNAFEPLSAEAKKRIQSRIDDLGEVFVSTVARNRGVSEKSIRDTEALCYNANDATSNGLADTTGPTGDAIAAFVAEMSKEDDTMTTKTQDTAAQDLTVATDTARAEGFAAGKAEGMSEGMTAEKTRVNAILASDEGKLRPASALAAAMKTSMSVEEASDFLAALPKEAAAADLDDAPKGAAGAAKDFKDAMDNAEHPKLGAPKETGDEGKETESRADRAIAMSGRKPKAA